jgi:hypothetical protein
MIAGGWRAGLAGGSRAARGRLAGGSRAARGRLAYRQQSGHSFAKATFRAG